MKTARPADVNATLYILLNLLRAVYSGYQRTHGFRAHIVTLTIVVLVVVLVGIGVLAVA